MSDSTATSTKLRVGILGCASISKKNVIAILHEKSGCCITAVASRTEAKVRAFVEDFLTPRLNGVTQTNPLCLGGSSAYDNLIQSDHVDALYIPLPTVFRKEWVMKALQAGKHVLVEKPVAVSVEEYEAMLAVAFHHNKYLQDGTMFVHQPRTASFVQAAKDSSFLGSITRIETAFSFCGDDAFHHDNIRVKRDADPLGCLGDLGWYSIRMALLVLDMTKSVAATVQATDYKLNDEGVPIDATCLVKFDNQVILTFHCGFQSHFRQYVHVVGTKGWVSMDDFVLPRRLPLQYELQSMYLTENDLITEHPCTVQTFPDDHVQEVLMWQTFALLARNIDDLGEGVSWAADASEDCYRARRLAQTSSANQRLVDGLMLSIQKRGMKVQVSLDPIWQEDY
jgi:predicted dehydrogenase